MIPGSLGFVKTPTETFETRELGLSDTSVRYQKPPVQSEVKYVSVCTKGTIGPIVRVEITFLLEVTMEHQPLRSSDIRERNEKIILNLIRSRTYLSQSEVTRLTGLRAPTAFRIFSGLETQGFIRSATVSAATEDKKGRKPQYFEVVPQAFYAFGIDFWALSATLSVCDFSGKVIYIEEHQFPSSMDVQILMDQLYALIQRAYKKAKIPKDRVLGFGIGAPGRIDLSQGLVLRYPRIAGLDNFPLGQRLSEKFGVPVYLHNNASLIALAEDRSGETEGSRSLFTFLVRSGVGGAYLEGGRAFTVLNRTAVEVGHMSLDCDGPVCSCGGRGCLEEYISEDAVLSFLPKSLNIKTFLDLDRAIETHRESILQALAESLRIFELGIRNIYTLFAPETFLIVSRSANYADLLASYLRERIGDLVRIDGTPVRLVSDRYNPARIGQRAGDLVFEHFLS